MTLWQKVVHQLYDFSRLIGLRDRLRCPECKAVGTFKPHGGWLDFEDKRKERRWMCKWCGAYSGPEKYRKAFPNMVQGCWTFYHQAGVFPTPSVVHEQKYRRSRVKDLRGWIPWPWEG